MSDTAVLAPAGDPARLAHLREDARVAQDLGIRYGDAGGGRDGNPANRGARTECTDRLFNEIVQRHNVSLTELSTALQTRERWVDVLAVFLPMSALLLLGTRFICRRMIAFYAPRDRRVAAAILLVSSPLIGAVAVFVGQTWGVIVEQLRLRDDHISYRAAALPAREHAWLLWGIASALFVGVGMVTLRRSVISPPLGRDAGTGPLHQVDERDEIRPRELR